MCAVCLLLAALEITFQALRGQLNWRKGVLDLMRDALRHLLPGGGLLRA